MSKDIKIRNRSAVPKAKTGVLKSLFSKNEEIYVKENWIFSSRSSGVRSWGRLGN